MKKLIITTATILTLAGGAFALQPNETTTATEKTPIEAQVENHEVRIGDLETKTDNTQTQVNQNTADIAAVQDKTGIAPAPQVQAVQTPVAQPEATTQTNIVTPTPEPVIDPWTVTHIFEEKIPNTADGRYPDRYNLHCKVTFYDGRIGWSISTTSDKYSMSPSSCRSNYRIEVGQVIAENMRIYLRFDTAPF